LYQFNKKDKKKLCKELKANKKNTLHKNDLLKAKKE